jgi:hypothetical protein
MTDVTPGHCEVCNRRLVPTEEVGVCFRCAQSGVKWARGWVRALRQREHDYDDIRGIVWDEPQELATA